MSTEAEAAAAAAAAAAAQKPWHETAGADAETVGLWTNKGWDVKDPAKVAIEATKSYQAAEKLIGAPAAQLLRLPADPTKDPDGMKAIFHRLGVPKDAKDYDLSAFKDAEGKVNQALDDTVRAALHKANVPKDAAPEVAASLAKYLSGITAASEADAAATLKTEKEMLAKNWGDKAAANMVIAQNAAAALGFTPEEVAGLEKVKGYAGIMEKMRDIGTRIGEAKFLQPNTPGGNPIASREQAQARITELKADTAWRDRYLANGAAEVKEMNDLQKIAFDPDKA